MKYISLFSGIGGFDLGFDRAGMTCMAQVERDKAADGVLSRHWPDVARFDDVCTFGKDSINESIDLICGGFPCQDLSVAGRRAGLAGERSGLWFEFARIVDEFRPQWIVVENVPGLLSSGPVDETTEQTRAGIDFAIVLAGLTGVIPTVPNGGWRNSGFMRGRRGFYSVAWRVLDAQYFGVAQRRRRVFIVASLGNGRAAQVLFESDSVRRDSAPRREEGQNITNAIRASLGSGGADDNRAQGGHLIAKALLGKSGHRYEPTSETLVAGTLPENYAKASGNALQQDGALVFEPRFTRNGRGAPDTIAPPLKAENGKSGKGDGAPVVAFHHRASASQTMNPSEVSPSLDKSKEPAAMTANGVRRLMPVECERLQGFPDGWTAGQSDSARYRQTGNAVAVPVAEWIGRRITEVA